MFQDLCFQFLVFFLLNNRTFECSIV
jgi:hypothetical protein